MQSNKQMTYNLRILDTPEDMQAVEDLQGDIWSGSDRDVIPGHLLVAMARNGGLVIGAFAEDQLVGFVCGFAGLVNRQQGYHMSHVSHALAVRWEHRNQGIAFGLKRAQWQMVRHQDIQHITWTYDPLLGLNAHLNISRLGAVCNTYRRSYYGAMRDRLNAGIPSDRFVIDWWVNSSRVRNRMSKQVRRKLDLAHYLAAEVPIINPTRLEDSGLPAPGDMTPTMQKLLEMGPAGPEKAPLILIEIPADFQSLRRENLALASIWREHTRQLFESAFEQNYMVTDFIHLPGKTARSFYVLSRGDVTLGGVTH